MLTKKRLVKLFSEKGFTPLKRLGENYLIDENIKDKIIRAASLIRDDAVLEIGPGFGALTFDIAKSAGKVTALEIDRKACAILKELAGEDHPNLTIINGDILKFDIAKAAGANGRLKVIGNLPYYITTPIVERLIDNRMFIESIIIMTQKEVGARFMACAGSADYSSISCFVNYFTASEYIHTVKRTSFFPSPEVDSCILRLTLLARPSVEVGDEEKFFRIIRGSFNQRRKSIVNSLSRPAVLDMPKEKLAGALKEAGIAPSSRPEELSLRDFAAISNALTP
jgi:16S rRNA (adenine1518-N6/adenine1519-N6)-dimethyltransferase